MRAKFLFFVFVLASFALAGCWPTESAPAVNTPTPDITQALSAEEVGAIAAQAAANAVQTAMAVTPTHLPTEEVGQVETSEPTDTPEPTETPTATPTAIVRVEGQAEEPEPTDTPEPTETPTATPTLTPAVPQLRTASDIRSLGRVIGWVTGGANGEFVQGAQVALKSDFSLKTLPEGEVFEFECVHYIVINGEVNTKPVCDGSLVRFGTDSVVPAGSIGTLWLTHPVVGSKTEKWAEGFLNAPCLCADGDCRDE